MSRFWQTKNVYTLEEINLIDETIAWLTELSKLATSKNLGLGYRGLDKFNWPKLKERSGPFPAKLKLPGKDNDSLAIIYYALIVYLKIVTLSPPLASWQPERSVKVKMAKQLVKKIMADGKEQELQRRKHL
ncbi:hypothetical protein [Lentilactobacillus hilgardii]|uniref:hypothetical protein n=1 Tax=Lentilactobacillus hilgardii TaxID=1588 RepID=UPI0021A4326B|nr:hypothetical protein [Lentilactobacillus hilgardii]MCP9333943.1 hypothetical protein [Lentilactobacillus hilgardii]MCP9350541.1 hypothetical protein [Lentilactobacillus hilgardii]MCP9353437.1 hypothetical protein [Lentilactobacillus hilgardii]MCT3397590.1 hypothetical protein [Lentilactobacillus hilgardii]